MDGELLLDREFGGRAALSLDFPAALLRNGFLSGDAPADDANIWNVYMAAEDLQLGRIIESFLDMETPFRITRGDVVVWGELAGTKPQSITMEVDLTDIEFETAGERVEIYQRISGQFEWGLQDDGWLLAGSDLEITRDNNASPTSNFAVAYKPGANGAWTEVLATSDFFRLHDWYPMILGIASDDARSTILFKEIHGDLREFNLDLRLAANGPIEYELETDFAEIGISSLAGGESVFGMSGSMVADQEGGRLQIDSTGPILELPALFSGPLRAESIEGFMVWRVTDNQVRVLSDNIQIRTPGIDASSRFELSVPRDGESPRIDLNGFVTAARVREVLPFLPIMKFSPKIRTWLNRSIVSGRVTGAQIELRGPLRKFPFPRGEGGYSELRWMPRAASSTMPKIGHASKTLTRKSFFDGVSVTSLRNRGRIGGISTANISVTIPDLRSGLIGISGRQTVDLDAILKFIRATPVNDFVGREVRERNRCRSGGCEIAVPVAAETVARFRFEYCARRTGCSVGNGGSEFWFYWYQRTGNHRENELLC